MFCRRTTGIVIGLLLASTAGGQTLDLGPVARPSVNTGEELAARFIVELEASSSERERSMVRVAAALHRLGDPASELAARTIDKHLDMLRGVLRDAADLANDSGTDAVLRQRLREELARIDVIAADVFGMNESQLQRLTERLFGAIADLAMEVEGEIGASPIRFDAADDASVTTAEDLRTRVGALAEPFAGSSERLGELVDLFESVRGVPSLEVSATRGLRAIEGVVACCELSGDGFLVRSAVSRLPIVLERCLMSEDGSRREPIQAIAMLRPLARIGAMVSDASGLDGDTARRLEPVIGSMLADLRSPENAELIELVLLPVERSIGLIVRGAGLPAPSAVSPQLQYAWRFLLPQEQAARIAAIDAIAMIPGDPDRIASPELVSALVGHAGLVESLEALLEVDRIQDELDRAGIPGAADALDALRVDLRLMGDRRGYRQAGDRVLPILRTIARYRDLPGMSAVMSVGDDEAAWGAPLKQLLSNRLEPMRVRLAMELIGAANGSEVATDGERSSAEEALETLRRTVMFAADLLTLDVDARDRLDALPEFEWFEGGSTLGHSEAIGIERVESAVAEAVVALGADDAQRAGVVLDRVETESRLVGVLAELARHSSGVAPAHAAGASMEAALVLRRLGSLGPGSAALVELSLVGRYPRGETDERALLRYAADQAERAIDQIDWLREAWQRRR